MSADGPETWKPIPGYESRYLISDLGRIRGRYGREVRTHEVAGLRGGYGHRRVSLCGSDRQYRTFKLHRLVLMAFIGPAPAGMQACHNNGKASDNRLTNLRWDTVIANRADMHLHGTVLTGVHHPSAKLSEDQVQQIRVLGATVPHSVLARQFGVAHISITRIVRRELWRHLP